MAKEEYLIDTCVIVDGLRGYKPAMSFLDSITLVKISAVTYAELLQGCRNRDDLRKTQQLAAGFLVLPVDEATCDTGLRLLEKHFLKDGITFNDALIAAAALRYELSLITTEKKHFTPVKDLTLIMPYGY